MAHRFDNRLALHPAALPLLMIVGGVVPLTVALLLQYVGGLHPCHFCLLARYPYAFVAAAGLLALGTAPGDLARRLLTAAAICGWLATALLSAIHVGIEQHWLHYTGGCVAQPLLDHSLAALRAAITGAPIVACDQAAAKLLGLSLAAWNVLCAVGFIIVTFALHHRARKAQSS